MIITEIPLGALFGTIVTLASAHEPEQIAAAKANLEKWDITFDEGLREIERRESA